MRVAFRFRALRLVAFVATCCGVDGVRADAIDSLVGGDWHRYRSTHFVLFSPLPEATVAEYVRDLELFRTVVFRITNAQPFEDTVPMQFFLMPRRGDVVALADNPHVLGFMRPSLRANVMVASPGTLTQDGTTVVLHEYVHYLLRGAGVAYAPKWYDEGLAEMLATTRLRDGRVMVGLSANERVDSLRQGIHVSLEEVVTTDDLSAMHAYRRSVYYAKAWALTHYLHAGHILGGPDRNPDLNRYLARVQQPGSRRDAFEACFGLSIREMERELGKYLSTAQRPVLALPADRFEFDAGYERGRAAEQEIAYLLGYVAVPTNPLLARKAFERILATKPGDARTLAAVGVAHQFERSETEADAILAKARVAAPDDPLVAIERADFLMAWCRDAERAPPDCPQRREEALGAYEVALAAQPDSLEAQLGVATGLLENGIDAARAEKLLRAVRERARWSLDVELWLAIALLRQGVLDEAEVLARRVLYRAEQDAMRQRAQATLDEIVERRRASQV